MAVVIAGASGANIEMTAAAAVASKQPGAPVVGINAFVDVPITATDAIGVKFTVIAWRRAAGAFADAAIRGRAFAGVALAIGVDGAGGAVRQVAGP